jgi:hypothetical protein
MKSEPHRGSSGRHPSRDWLCYRGIAKTLIDLSLDDLDELSDLLETALAARLRSELAETASPTGPSGGEGLSARGRQMRVRIKHVLISSMMRQSLFLTCHALLESRMNDLCDRLQGRYGLAASYRDMHGRGLERARTYLVKVVGLRVAADGRTWPIIQNLGKVRNLIAHAGGRPSEKEERVVISELARLKSGSIKTGVFGMVELGSSFVPFAVDTYRSFLHELCKNTIES